RPEAYAPEDQHGHAHREETRQDGRQEVWPARGAQVPDARQGACPERQGARLAAGEEGQSDRQREGEDRPQGRSDPEQVAPSLYEPASAGGGLFDSGKASYDSPITSTQGAGHARRRRLRTDQRPVR